MKKENKGISLIVLIITIIVIIILAGAVILSLTNSDIFDTANQAVFKNDVSELKAELEIYKSNRYLEEREMFNPKFLFAKKQAETLEGLDYLEIKNVITNIIKKEYDDKFIVFEGELVYTGNSEKEEEWSKDIGIESLKVTGSIEAVADISSIQAEIKMMGIKSKLDQVQHFKWSIKEKNGSNFELKYTSVNKEDTTYTFTNIKPNTEYVVKVEVVGIEVTIKEKSIVTVADAKGPNVSIDIQNAVIDGNYLTRENVSALVTILDNENESGTDVDNCYYMISKEETLTKEQIEVGTKLSFKDESTAIINQNGATFTSGSYYIHVLGNDAAGNSTIQKSGKIIIDVDKPIFSASDVTTVINLNDIKATANATDEHSKIAGYKYSLDNVTYTELKENTHTFTGLKSDTSYTIHVIAVDKAGNEIKVTKQVTTGNITGSINLSKTPASWTNSNVTVNASYSGSIPEGYVLQMNVGQTAWESKTSIVVTNNVTVYARLYNSTIDEEKCIATSIVNKIDRVNPTVTITTPIFNSGTSTITATINSLDENGIDMEESKYIVNTNNTAVVNDFASGTAISSTSQGVSKSISVLGTYYVHALVYDKAGNSSIKTSSSIIIDSISFPIVSVIKPGDYVQYTGGGCSSWRVLHSNINGQVQIMSKTTVKDIKLGDDRDIVKCKSDYANAVKILNDEAQAYINTNYADKARSLGSDPTNPRKNDTVDIGSIAFENNTTVDANSTIDINAINSANIKLDKNFWIASRGVYPGPSDYAFYVRHINLDGNEYYNYICRMVANGREDPIGSTYSFVPVISLKSGIRVSGGNGTEASPWILIAM